MVASAAASDALFTTSANATSVATWKVTVPVAVLWAHSTAEVWVTPPMAIPLGMVWATKVGSTRGVMPGRTLPSTVGAGTTPRMRLMVGAMSMLWVSVTVPGLTSGPAGQKPTLLLMSSTAAMTAGAGELRDML